MPLRNVVYDDDGIQTYMRSFNLYFKLNVIFWDGIIIAQPESTIKCSDASLP